MFSKIFNRRSREVIIDRKAPAFSNPTDLSAIQSDDDTSSIGSVGSRPSLTDISGGTTPPESAKSSFTASPAKDATGASSLPRAVATSSHHTTTTTPNGVQLTLRSSMTLPVNPLAVVSSPGSNGNGNGNGNGSATTATAASSSSSSSSSTTTPGNNRNSSLLNDGKGTVTSYTGSFSSNSSSRNGTLKGSRSGGSGEGSPSSGSPLLRRNSDGNTHSVHKPSRHKRHVSVGVIVSASTAERAAEVKSVLQRKYQSIRAANGRYNPLEKRRTLQLFMQNDMQGDEDHINLHKTIPMLRPSERSERDVEDEDNSNKWGWLTSRSFIRLYQRNLGFKTLACDLYTTTKEICMMATEKFNLSGKENYHIYVQLHDCAAERRLEDDEQPLLLQQQWLRDLGYTDDDALQQQGRYDHSHMFRFLFSNTSTSMEHSWEQMGRKFEAFALGIGVSSQRVKAGHKVRPSLLLQYTDELDLSNHSLGTLLYRESTTLSSLLLNNAIQASLGRLNLAGNVLQSIPKEICALHQLSALDLSNNLLTALPAEFMELSRLEVLNLSQNDFDVFPVTVCQLSRLKALAFAENKLSSLPADIAALSSLEKLDIRGNRLTSLNPAVVSMDSLRWINIRSNQIDALPPPPSDKMCSIQHLLCDENLMSIARIYYPSLHEITVRYNNVTVFAPPSIELICLAKLDLSGNKLISLPDSIDRLSSLRFLILDNNRLTRLPNTLTKLAKLETLSVARNALTSLPENITNLRRLRHLLIQINNLTHLPEELWFLPSLLLLNAGSNLLQYLPDIEIGMSLKSSSGLFGSVTSLSNPSAALAAASASSVFNYDSATSKSLGEASASNAPLSSSSISISNSNSASASNVNVSSINGKQSEGAGSGPDAHKMKTSQTSLSHSGSPSSLRANSGTKMPSVGSENAPVAVANTLANNPLPSTPAPWDPAQPASGLGVNLRLAMLLAMVNDRGDTAMGSRPISLLQNPCDVVPDCPTSLSYEGHVKLRGSFTKSSGAAAAAAMASGRTSSISNGFDTVRQHRRHSKEAVGSLSSRFSTITSPPAGAGSPDGAGGDDPNANEPRRSSLFGTLGRSKKKDKDKDKDKDKKKGSSSSKKNGRSSYEASLSGSMSGSVREGVHFQEEASDDVYDDDDSWPRLRELYLGDNKLGDDCLQVISRLKNLRVLHLGNNALMEIEGLGKLTKLRSLCLSGNDIAYVSEDIENLSCLHSLFISNNKLSNLPAELSKLKHLWTVDARDNNLKWNLRNEEFDWNWNLNTELRHLDISGNKRFVINDPAVDFHGLTQLSLLGLEGVQVYNEMPEHLKSALRIVKEPDTKVGARFARFDFRSGVAELRPDGYRIIPPTAHALNRRPPSSPLFFPSPSGASPAALSSSQPGSSPSSPGTYSGPITPEMDGAFTEFLRVDRYHNRPRLSLFGLFDGHRGGEVSKFVKENFLAVFEEEMDKCNQDAIRGLRRAFLSLNRKLGVARIGKFCGASGLVVYLVNDMLYAANAGNAMAVLCRSGRAKLLSVKHHAAVADERERIRKVGGVVSDDHLVYGAVDVGRAFGDFFWSPCVNGDPHTTSEPLLQEDEFIILACRGLWDVMTPQMAVDIAKTEPTPSKAAQKLRDFAWLYGARDNITVMVVFTPSSARNKKNRAGRAVSQNYGMDKLPGGGSVIETIKPPVGKVTLVFTDIHNSLVLWESYENAMRQAVKDHNDLLRKLLRAHRGYEVKTEGEAFMVAFDNPVNALRWCLNVQLQLLDVSWPEELLATDDCKPISSASTSKKSSTSNSANAANIASAVRNAMSPAAARKQGLSKLSGSQTGMESAGLDSSLSQSLTNLLSDRIIWRGLRVRMGIHTGNPDCEPDPVTGRMDYFGPTVNRSARVSAVADGGQIVVSSSAWEELDSCMELFTDATVADLGSFELKGMEKKENIKQVLPTVLHERSSFFLHPPKSQTGPSVSFAPVGSPATMKK